MANTARSVRRRIKAEWIRLTEQELQSVQLEPIESKRDDGRGFDPAHALIVRPLGDRFQIVSGHHRHEAAKRAGLPSVAAWVREMDDETAYMELVKSNAQSELTALERGLHALRFTEKGKHGKSVSAYAAAIGGVQQVVDRQVKAAEVAQNTPRGVTSDLIPLHRHLTEIHAAPRWLWSALVEKLVAEELSVNDTKALVSDIGHDLSKVFSRRLPGKFMLLKLEQLCHVA